MVLRIRPPKQKQKRSKIRNKEQKHKINNQKDRKSSSSFSSWLNLHSVEEMPKHLQFNKFITKGYRKLTDWKGCLISLFFFHNETANILTHAPVAMFTIMYYYEFWPWEELRGTIYLYGLGIAHTTAVVVPWVPSFLYHLFMCHKGSKVYSALLRFDMLGIWMVEFFGSLTNLAASLWNLPEGLQGALFGAFIVTSVYGLIKSMRADTPRGRVICFAPLLIGRILGVLLRISPWGGGEIHGVLHHVILQDVTSIVGGFIGVGRIPEKWMQGKCDYCFNSHNIMHLFVILAVYHMNEAANMDVRWLISQIN